MEKAKILKYIRLVICNVLSGAVISFMHNSGYSHLTKLKSTEQEKFSRGGWSFLMNLYCKRKVKPAFLVYPRLVFNSLQIQYLWLYGITRETTS